MLCRCILHVFFFWAHLAGPPLFFQGGLVRSILSSTDAVRCAGQMGRVAVAPMEWLRALCVFLLTLFPCAAPDFVSSGGRPLQTRGRAPRLSAFSLFLRLAPPATSGSMVGSGGASFFFWLSFFFPLSIIGCCGDHTASVTSRPLFLLQELRRVVLATSSSFSAFWSSHLVRFVLDAPFAVCLLHGANSYERGLISPPSDYTPD